MAPVSGVISSGAASIAVSGPGGSATVQVVQRRRRRPRRRTWSTRAPRTCARRSRARCTSCGRAAGGEVGAVERALEARVADDHAVAQAGERERRARARRSGWPARCRSASARRRARCARPGSGRCCRRRRSRGPRACARPRPARVSSSGEEQPANAAPSSAHSKSRSAGSVPSSAPANSNSASVSGVRPGGAVVIVVSGAVTSSIVHSNVAGSDSTSRCGLVAWTSNVCAPPGARSVYDLRRAAEARRRAVERAQEHGVGIGRGERERRRPVAGGGGRRRAQHGHRRRQQPGLPRVALRRLVDAPDRALGPHEELVLAVGHVGVGDRRRARHVRRGVERALEATRSAAGWRT